MSAQHYINHMTLDTGHNRRSPRSEAGRAALELVAAHLRRALDDGTDAIPMSDHRLHATRLQAALLCTILAPDGAPVLTFGVAGRNRVAGRLWDMLTEGRTYPAVRPEAPWVAARFDDPERLMAIAGWVADYERLVAWAWIEGLAAEQ